MKKSILSLGGVAVLSNEEQKMVKGGGKCAVYIPHMEIAEGQTMPYHGYGKTLEEAKGMAEKLGGHWCCSSCGTASWY